MVQAVTGGARDDWDGASISAMTITCIVTIADEGTSPSRVKGEKVECPDAKVQAPHGEGAAPDLTVWDILKADSVEQ